jgi:serine/threonine protein kinase
MEAVPEAPIANAGELVAGKYLVERVIGEGGMGVVVAAMHQELGERVALKFLRRTALSNAEIVGRFRNEARAAARLKSDHIARVLDVGQHGDCPFMVMEFLDGDDLSKRLQSGPVDREDAVDFAIQACEGLAEAHSREIVHRDIKPENLFLVEHSGIKTVKILDFGISKAALSGTANNFQTSSIMGSPVYMSPEQLRSTRDVDLRTDIWSIGAVLFELLSGTTPFPSDVTLTELVASITLSPPRDLAAVRADIPAELADVVMRCLAKAPQSRWQNTGELACALLPWAPRRSHTVAERAVTRLKAAGIPIDTGDVQVPSYRPSAAGNSTTGPVSDPHARTTPAVIAPPGVSTSSSSSPVRSAPPRMSSTTGEPVSTGSPTDAPLAPQPKKNPLVFGAVVAAIALALGVVAFVKFKPAPAVDKTAHAATPPTAAAPESIDIVLRGDPRETRFTIDDGQPLENPYVGKAKRDGSTHVIHAHAPGYKDKTREVTFDSNVSIGLLLQKDPKATPPK